MGLRSGGIKLSLVRTGGGQTMEEQCSKEGGHTLRFLSPMAFCPQKAAQHSTAKAMYRFGRLRWAGRQSLVEQFQGCSLPS